MARKIVVTSGKGGVGKTSVTANLGIKLSSMGKKVVLIDLDIGLNNLDIVMGVESKIVYDIVDVIEGRCRAKQALVQCFDKPNLFVLSSGSKTAKNRISGQNVKVITEGLDCLFDYIIVDCPAGVDYGFHRAVSVASEAIVVTTPHISSIRDADKTISVLRSYDLDDVYLVVNMARGDMVVDGNVLSPESIEEVLKIPLIGVIPEDDKVFLSCGSDCFYRKKSGKAFKMLANNLEKGTKRIYACTKGYKGVLGSIKRSLKRSL